MSDVIHIDDLAAPTFPPEAQPIVDGMAAMVDYCPLDADTCTSARPPTPASRTSDPRIIATEWPCC